MNRKTAIDTSTKGSRPTAMEVSAALAIFAALDRPKRPPSRPK